MLKSAWPAGGVGKSYNKTISPNYKMSEYFEYCYLFEEPKDLERPKYGVSVKHKRVRMRSVSSSPEVAHIN